MSKPETGLGSIRRDELACSCRGGWPDRIARSTADESKLTVSPGGSGRSAAEIRTALHLFRTVAGSPERAGQENNKAL